MILVSTHDLPRAGALRTALSEAGFEVELVTPDERLDRQDAALLLALTGGLEGGAEGLVRQARRILEVPVVAWAPWRGGSVPEVAEVFAPSSSVDEVALVGGRLAERTRLQRVTGIVGATDAMQEVLERVVQIAPVSSTVLVTGESGTGKELVARGIHLLSPRRHKPFIAVNVAALPDTLLESELFGHEKGAFTGAIDSRKGLFELAESGTIFLDEIGEMPLATQTKLLRVLEQREFLRVGGEKPRRIDVRIVAATNQDLRDLVRTREFRQDLYYRLNVLHISLPPLRERRADIPLLVRQFSRELAERVGRPFPGITDEAMEILARHSWPGNVRELRNLVESMVVLAPGSPIQPRDIPAEIQRGDAGGGSRLLPVPIPRAAEQGGAGDLRPQLEFIFRTLVEMRVDIDDLRKDFEAWRDDVPRMGGSEVGVLSKGLPADPADSGAGLWPDAPILDPDDEVEPGAPEGVVVYRDGMTMEDLEREAITAALRAVGGNRRKAAERLEIGERTLYRKIKKFGLDQ
ncbi:sigma-54 dependent transcriptional regulator [Gaopeijia maritima]|uniref:sigma-54 interaction domain-containing protein n=1 Tax=Gaopeijia maritima TaxID=3119007 RepID=UPI00324BE932